MENRTAAEETTGTAVVEDRAEDVGDDFRTAQQELPPTDSGVTARDVVPPGRMLLPEKIESLLGIPAERIRRAIRAGELPPRGADAVTGITLLRWIDEHGIAHRVSEAAAAEHRRAEAASRPAERPKGLVEAAAEELGEWGRGDGEAAETQYSDYVQILLRSEAPADDDARRLADLMLIMEIGPEQVAEDQRIIKKAQDLEALHDGRETAAKKAAAAGRTYREWLVAKDKEQRVRHVEMRSLAIQAERCGRAAGELLILSRQRPELFAVGDPPRINRATPNGK